MLLTFISVFPITVLIVVLIAGVPRGRNSELTSVIPGPWARVSPAWRVSYGAAALWVGLLGFDWFSQLGSLARSAGRDTVAHSLLIGSAFALFLAAVMLTIGTVSAFGNWVIEAQAALEEKRRR